MDTLIIGPDGKAVLPQPDDIPDKDKSDAMGSYLMMFVAVAVGLPLPFLNIIAAIVYFVVNKKKRFVAFHAYQSLISQIFVSLLNAVLVVWLIVNIVLSSFGTYSPWTVFSVPFFCYTGFTFICNILYVIYSITGCVKANKGILYYMPVFGKMSYNKYYGEKAAAVQEQEKTASWNRPPGM